MHASTACKRIVVITATVIGALAMLALAQAEQARAPGRELQLRERLVEVLSKAASGVLDEARVGQRTMREVLDSEERLFGANEALAVARVKAEYAAPSEKQIAEASLATTREYVKVLRLRHGMAKQRFAVGEVTQTDVLQAEAAVLAAELREGELAASAGAGDGKN